MKLKWGSPLGILIGFAIWWLAIDAALTYGGIWQLRAHPQPRVQAGLQGGQMLKGTLTRDWDRMWVLKGEDGTQVRFSEAPSLSIHLPSQPLEQPDYWRSALPVALVNVAFAAYILVGFFRWRRSVDR